MFILQHLELCLALLLILVSLKFLPKVRPLKYLDSKGSFNVRLKGDLDERLLRLKYSRFLERCINIVVCYLTGKIYFSLSVCLVFLDFVYVILSYNFTSLVESCNYYLLVVSKMMVLLLIW